jgi:putative transcriptional regulator
MSQEIVVNNVSEFRSKSKVTQEDLAQAIGVTRQTVIAIEKGNYTPSTLLALKISRFFKTPLESIFSLKDDK